MKLFPRNVLLVFCNQSRLLSSSRGPAISPDPGGDGENHLQRVLVVVGCDHERQQPASEL